MPSLTDTSVDSCQNDAALLHQATVYETLPDQQSTQDSQTPAPTFDAAYLFMPILLWPLGLCPANSPIYKQTVRLMS